MDQVCSVIFLSLCNVPCQRRTRRTLKSYTSFFPPFIWEEDIIDFRLSKCQVGRDEKKSNVLKISGDIGVWIWTLFTVLAFIYI